MKCLITKYTHTHIFSRIPTNSNRNANIRFPIPGHRVTIIEHSLFMVFISPIHFVLLCPHSSCLMPFSMFARPTNRAYCICHFTICICGFVSVDCFIIGYLFVSNFVDCLVRFVIRLIVPLYDGWTNDE